MADDPISPRRAAREWRRLFDDPTQNHNVGEIERLVELAGERELFERLRLARTALRAAAREVEAPPHFAHRVLARLPDGPLEMLGWAAFRLLPMAFALALVLTVTYARLQGDGRLFPDLSGEAFLVQVLLGPPVPPESGS